ncbi:hypothetical protein Droror1_Dr00027683, partial [Drosera rotundifolia]
MAFPELSSLDVTLTIEEKVAVLVSPLKVKVPAEWLALALTHVDESPLVDAAETIFLNPKTSGLPSHLELHLMGKELPMNMRL